MNIKIISILKISLFFLLAAFLQACTSTKQVSYEELVKNAPDWVKKTPTSTIYYHGVGTATKSSGLDYRERAQQSALSEIANSISVNVSSSSVLNSFQQDNSYSEFYKNNSKVSSKEFLEGFEVADSYENKSQYWVYYRLSKSKFEQIKQERINKALNASISNYKQAKTLANEGNVANAFKFYVVAIEDISDFLGEDLKYNDNGVEKPYATQLMNDFIGLIKNIKIIYPSGKIAIKKGSSSANLNVEAKVVDEKNRSLSGIPVITQFTWAPGANFELISDASGGLRIVPRKLETKNSTEQILSLVHIDKMVRNNTSNMMVRKFLEGVKVDNFVYPVEIIPPVIAVEVVDKENKKPLKNSVVANEIVSLIRQDGYALVKKKETPDFTIYVEISVLKSNEVNGKFSTNILGDIYVKDAEERTVFSVSEQDLAGLGVSAAAAEEDAYKSFAGKIKISIYPNIKKSVF